METIFLRVLNMSFSSAAVIGVILLLRLPLRSAPKKWRYLLWSAAGFRLCCPVSFKAVFSIFRLQPAMVSAVADTRQIPVLPGAVPSAAPIRISAAAASASPAAQLAPAAVPTAASAASRVPAAQPVQLWPGLGIALWLCGLAVMLTLGLIRYVRMKRLLGDAAAVEEGVFATDRIRVPFILGLLPPRIYIPAGLTGEELSYVTAHERAHLRRGDHWIKLLAYLLLAVHWFNPAVWAAFFLMSRDMEMSCDEKVLRKLKGSAKAYSRTLLRFAEGRQFPAPAPLGFGESDAKSRIKNALRWKRPKLWITLTAFILCIAAVAACAADPKKPEKNDVSAAAEGDTVCFFRNEQGILMQGAEGAKSFGEIADALALRDFTYHEGDNYLRPEDRLLSGESLLAIGMSKDAALNALYADLQSESEKRNAAEPRFYLRNDQYEFYAFSGLFAGEPIRMTLRYTNGGLLFAIQLDFYPLQDLEEAKQLYGKVKQILAKQLGKPDTDGTAPERDTLAYAVWAYPGGGLSLKLTGKDDSSFTLRVFLSGETETTSPWSWSSTLETSDIREAAFRWQERGLEYLLTAEQIEELTELLRAVPKESVAQGRGIPSTNVLELRDTGYALRFAGGVIELDFTDRQIAEQYGPAVWEIRDDALYLWLDAMWRASPFDPHSETRTDPLGLTLEVKDASATGCTLVFDQLGGERIGGLMTGEAFILEVQDGNGEWTELPGLRELAWHDIGFPIAADGRTELNTGWGRFLGSLEDGHYRISKSVVHTHDQYLSDFYRIYAEFTLIGGKGENAAEPEDNPWSWIGTLQASDLREASLWAASGRLRLSEEQAEELAALLNAVSPENIVRDRGIPAGQGSTLMFPDAEHALRFADGMIQLEGPESAAIDLNSHTRWMIRDEALYAWLDALVVERRFDGKIDALGLTLDVQEATPTSCSLAFTQYGGEPTGTLNTGAAFLLERETEDGEWYELPGLREVPWYAVAYGIAFGETTRMTADWEQILGPLEDGHYRISKEVMDLRGPGDFDRYTITAEFVLPAGAAGGEGPDADRGDWREAYRQFFLSALEVREYESHLKAPLYAAGLLDLSGNGVPELILFDPGASVSAGAAVFTWEEGELRAFHAERSYGLPLAKHAMEYTVWANDQVNSDQTPAFRYCTENGEAFWLLNSRNAAWPADAWCSWLRFGRAEDGCLAAQSLLSLAVEGEENDRGEYTETGWRVNGEAVTREAYHAAEEEFVRWRDSLEIAPFDPGAYLSCRDGESDLPERFDTLLANWRP